MFLQSHIGSYLQYHQNQNTVARNFSSIFGLTPAVIFDISHGLYFSDSMIYTLISESVKMLALNWTQCFQRNISKSHQFIKILHLSQLGLWFYFFICLLFCRQAPSVLPGVLNEDQKSTNCLTKCQNISVGNPLLRDISTNQVILLKFEQQLKSSLYMRKMEASFSKIPRNTGL